jgi:hypothetical protein
VTDEHLHTSFMRVLHTVLKSGSSPCWKRFSPRKAKERPDLSAC